MFDADLIEQRIIREWCTDRVIDKILAIENAALPVVEHDGNLVIVQWRRGNCLCATKHGRTSFSLHFKRRNFEELPVTANESPILHEFCRMQIHPDLRETNLGLGESIVKLHQLAIWAANDGIILGIVNSRLCKTFWM